MRYAKSVVELIGNTPLLELGRLGQGLGAQVLAKCEFLNPMSIKDRPVRSIIEQAEARGDIQPGDTLIEATSGNTGMALAFIGALKGYKVVLCMSEIQSIERRKVLAALGAELVLTPKDGGTKAAKAKAKELHDQRPGSYYVGQHDNPDNRRAHFETTAEEIWRDTEGKVGVFVAAMGTCGTISGVGSALRPRSPKLHVVGVEPEGAALLSQGSWSPHRIMGTSPGFVPGLYDADCVDEIVTISEADAFATCRALAKREGILVGISAGAAACVALRLANQAEHRGKVIVPVLCDRGERYLSVEGLFDA